MIIKVVKILFLLISVFAFAHTANAQNQNSGTYLEVKTGSSNKDSNSRPKAPSLQRITCTYDGEYLVFDFVLPEGQCELTVRSIDNTNVVCETLDSNDLVAEVFVGNITDCEIEFTTQKGNTYSGTLYVGNE